MSDRLSTPRDSAPGAGRIARTIFVAGLIAGTLDILYAFVLWGSRGVGPARILRSVASGLLGESARTGGVGVAALGLFLHMTNAWLIAAVYVLASRKLPALLRRPFLFGPLYGIGVYLVMNYVVVPLSAVPSRGGSPPTVVWVTGLLVHMFLIGLPIALVARRGLSQADPVDPEAPTR